MRKPPTNVPEDGDIARDALKNVWGLIKREWVSRTWYGKLVYPIWVLGILSVATMVILLCSPMLIAKACDAKMNQLSAGVRKVTPPVYKND